MKPHKRSREIARGRKGQYKAGHWMCFEVVHIACNLQYKWMLVHLLEVGGDPRIVYHNAQTLFHFFDKDMNCHLKSVAILIWTPARSNEISSSDPESNTVFIREKYLEVIKFRFVMLSGRSQGLLRERTHEDWKCNCEILLNPAVFNYILTIIHNSVLNEPSLPFFLCVEIIQQSKQNKSSSVFFPF